MEQGTEHAQGWKGSGVLSGRALYSGGCGRHLTHLLFIIRSPIKTALERQKQAYKAGWLTSPNTYKKEEIEEIGTTTPKKITKVCAWGEALSSFEVVLLHLELTVFRKIFKCCIMVAYSLIAMLLS